MKPVDYIIHTRALLQSKDSFEAILSIAELALPEDAPPLIILIKGDCEEHKFRVEYVTEYDNPTEEQLHDFRQRLALITIGKLRQYLKDWDEGDTYEFTFGLSYVLTGLKAGFQDAYHVEHIAVNKSFIKAKTIPEALSAAKEWEGQLLGNIVLYKGQERGHKGGEVIPTYAIKNKAGTTLASGSLAVKIRSEFGPFGLDI